jgi:enediyne biosynthesis protein E4
MDTNSPNKNKPSPGAEEEVAHLDDAVIGRAFRGSFIALLVLLLAGGAAWMFWRKKADAKPTQVTKLSAPVNPNRNVPAIPSAKFTDVTAASGIHFVHYSGAYGDKLLPETMGGGVAFFDFDNDQDADLLFINGTDWPWAAKKLPKPPTMALYRNDGKGRFEDVTPGSGLDVSFFGMSPVVGDFDNDGLVDLFVTGVGGNRLFRNSGSGKFTNVTREAGVAGAAADWSSCAAWLDYDNDGKLDLFVGHYVRWSKEIDLEVGYKIDGVTRAYGQPMNFQGSFASLYHNDGDGKFSDVSAKSGVQIKNASTGVPTAKSLGVAPVDLNGDGWMDLVVANDTVQNFVFTNAQNGTFKEIGAISGVAFDVNGQTRGAMGIDAARYRNDHTMGIAIGNFANEMTAMCVSQGDSCTFSDEAIQEGVGPASRLLLKFGVFFFDYDLDGRLDLLTANGHLEEEIAKVQASQKYRQPAQLFWNNGAGFSVVPTDKAGSDLFKPMVGRGSAYADIDGDGDLDGVLTQVNGSPLLLRNDQNLDHHFLRLKLVGTKANRDAIGAWVKLRLGKETLSRQVMPTRSYLSQSELPVTIGLGKATQFSELEIIWPGGQVQKVTQARLDATTVVEEVR